MSGILLFGAFVLIGFLGINWLGSKKIYTIDDVINSVDTQNILDQGVATNDWFVSNQRDVLEPGSSVFDTPEYQTAYRDMEYINRYGNIELREPLLDNYIMYANRQPPTTGGGIRTIHKVTDNGIQYQKTDHLDLDPKNHSYPTKIFNRLW